MVAIFLSLGKFYVCRVEYGDDEIPGTYARGYPD